MKKRRVVITGIGSIKPAASESCVNISDYELVNPGFNQWRRLDRYCRLGIVAADQALRDSKLHNKPIEEAGIFIGTKWGAAQSVRNFAFGIKHQDLRAMSPNKFPLTVNNSLGGYLSIFKGAKGPNVTMTSGYTASCDALGYAMKLILNGTIDVAIVGGIEENSDARMKMYQELDIELVPKEGVGFCVLESFDHAMGREAKIYSELFAYKNLSQSDGCRRIIDNLGEVCSRDSQVILNQDMDMQKPYGALGGASTVVQINDILQSDAGMEQKEVILVYEEKLRASGLRMHMY